MTAIDVQPGDIVHVWDAVNGPRRGGGGADVPVCKVTAKTVYVEQYGRTLAFDRQSGRQKQDSYNHLHVWRSKEHRLAELALDAAWRELRRDMHMLQMPGGMTLDRIAEVRALIGIGQAQAASGVDAGAAGAQQTGTAK